MTPTGQGGGRSRETRDGARGGEVMKLLFAVRNTVCANKSLKAAAWYFWY
ncbi:tryptorubin family RiPP precursor [Streptacidiphilus anmyonensis]|nr:tryptorubin family RiPP precursor [Streptacidiphilus anmyonensis]